MNIGILGTGMVGQALADKLVSLGHHVKMGSRSAGSDKALEFVARHDRGASEGSFADAAAHGELLIVATHGTTALQVLAAAGNANIDGKIVIDISNPLDFSKGMPPTLSVVNTDSLGEQLQAAFPTVRLVKTLNTLAAPVMVNPGQFAETTEIFVSGNDAVAKASVIDLLKTFGWQAPIDLGDISTARGTEMFLALWIRLWGALGTPVFNIRIVR